MTYIDKSAKAAERQRLDEQRKREEAQDKREKKEIARLSRIAAESSASASTATALDREAAPVKMSIPMTMGAKKTVANPLASSSSKRKDSGTGKEVKRLKL